MPEQVYTAGQTFRLQFIWQIPTRDYLRALFEVKVVDIDAFTERYLNLTYNAFDPEIITSDAVRERFERSLNGEEYLLESPMRIDFFSGKL